MKHLKLVINNENKKKDVFFNKSELQLILNLYAKMVSSGDWKDYKIQRNFVTNLFKKKKKQGVYVYGPVGTGKTFLLNLFYQNTKVGKKIHFNHFMNDVHNIININQDRDKKLVDYVKQLSKKKIQQTKKLEKMKVH